MEKENAQETVIDDFEFDDFLSQETKDALGADKDQPVTPSPTEEKNDEVSTDTEVAEKTPPQVEAPKTEEEEVPQEGTDPDMPVRASEEPDWKYNYRLEIYERQKALKSASTETEKQEIRTEVNGIRKQLAQRSKAEVAEDPELPDDYDSLSNDLEKFEVLAKAKGFVSKDEIADILRHQAEVERSVATIDKAESDFLSRHPEMKLNGRYDNLVAFVGENFILEGKSYNGITTILEMAHDTLYPNQVAKKEAKTRDLATKMDAVDFSGSSASGEDDPQKLEDKKLVEDLKSKSGNDYSWAF